MTIKYTNSFFALGIITFFTLSGAIFGIVREPRRQHVGEESQGHTIVSDDVDFLTRYYNLGACAGSTWETITDTPTV